MHYSSLNLVAGSEAGSPSVEVISLADFKLHERIDGTDSDAKIADLLYAARRYAEDWTARAFMSQTWRVSYDFFPLSIELPRPPLQSVTHIKYIDQAGVLQTLDPSLYQVNSWRVPGRIVPAVGRDWPQTLAGAENAVQVTYRAGYGDNPADVPPQLRQAILLLASHWFEQREDVVYGAGTQQPFTIPHGVTSICNMHRAGWI